MIALVDAVLTRLLKGGRMRPSSEEIPSDFDEDWYLLINPDVAESGRNAREHYARSGRHEGRSYKRNDFVPLRPADMEHVRSAKREEHARIQALGSGSLGTQNVAVVAHFDKNNILDDHFERSLRAYRRYFDYIILVTTSSLDLQQMVKGLRLADRIIQRDNVGYDFMSWRVGFETLALASVSSITFLNDSVYGPCGDLDAVLGAVDGVDLWGASLSREIQPHVQSFCMRFGPRLITSGFASAFWSSVGVINDKQTLILNYEVGLSYLVVRAGFTIGALVDLGHVSETARTNALADNRLSVDDNDKPAYRTIMRQDKPNPTQLFWMVAIRAGFPFVKIEILRTNPMGVHRPAVLDALRERGYDIDIVLHHLRRVMEPDAYRRLLHEMDADAVPHSAARPILK